MADMRAKKEHLLTEGEKLEYLVRQPKQVNGKTDLPGLDLGSEYCSDVYNVTRLCFKAVDLMGNQISCSEFLMTCCFKVISVTFFQKN